MIILELASLDTLFLCYVLRASKPGFVLSLFLNFLPKPRLSFLSWNYILQKEYRLFFASKISFINVMTAIDSTNDQKTMRGVI